MYFITSGSIGVGYHLYQQPLVSSRFNICHTLGQNNYFGDYYIFNNIRAEFVHIATSEVEAFSISKKFLVRKIFPKYPTVYREIKEDSKHRYTTTVKEPILKHKINHIEVVNKRSTYNEI
jgi:hypothetical protein